MMEIARHTRAVFIRHPWALVSMLSAPLGRNALRHMEQCLEALAKTTITTKQKITLLAMVDDFVFGHALREAATDTTVNVEFAATLLAREIAVRMGSLPVVLRFSATGRPSIGGC
jgi:Tetracyclin repressor-like, C-terminal domain